MKRLLLLVALLSLAFAAPDCGGGGENPTPTPRPTNPVPTATAVVPTPTAVIPPPTATAIPPTPVPTPPLAMAELDPPLPKLLGYTQLGDMADALDWNGYNFQSNEDSAKEMVANGFQAVHLWPHETVMSKDIKGVICNPDIRVIVIRPQSRISRDTDNCTEDPTDASAVWENADYGQIAWDLLNKHGMLECRGRVPLDIILNHWEGDWQAKGAHCRLEVPSERRLHRLRSTLEMAQFGVNWAREEHPHALLRVMFAAITNHRTDDHYEWTMTRDLIPYLSPQPDLIGLSFYTDQGRETPAQAVETTQRWTGYPVSRIFVTETGVSENWEGKQQRDLAPRLVQMEEAGLRLIFIWTWKQYWPGQLKDDGTRKNDWFGHWEVDENSGEPTQNSFTGEWTSGLKAVSTLRMLFEENPLPAVTPPAGGTPTPTMTPTPRPPTATPTPPDDPCGHCPPINSAGCTVNWSHCMDCWNDCGQPYETPTPAPSTPTRTPTGGVVLPTHTPTPTPDPSDPCGHCPDPDSWSCQMWPHTCEPCWEECGQPLATPTPRPPTPTPTPPPLNDNPTLSINFEGHPDSCTVVTKHEDTGKTKSYLLPNCDEVNLSFDELGLWQISMTAEYLHGWAVDDVHEVPPTDEEAADPLFVGKMNGDLDGDGKYEFRYIRGINILPRPESADPIA